MLPAELTLRDSFHVGRYEDGGTSPTGTDSLFEQEVGALHARVAAGVRRTHGSHHPASQPELAASPRDIFLVNLGTKDQRVCAMPLRQLLK